MIGLKEDCVYLCNVDNNEFKLAYGEEYKKLAALLKGYFVSIEHVGSTAVPGLIAKPIVDIAVGINNFEDIEQITSILEQHEYIYLKNHGDISRRIFIKKKEDNITHHIHIEEFGKESWKNHVLFRDKLLKFKGIRNEYNGLKLQLVKKYSQDRNKYTLEKAEFIQRVLHER